MILECPSCQTQYFAEDSTIGTGRKVRCASCGNSWFAQPELSLKDEMAASDFSRETVERERRAMDPSQPHQAFREREFSKAKGRSRMAATMAWCATAGAFFAAGAGAILYRDDVVRMWPQASGAYAMAGLDVNAFGLELVRVDADRSFQGTMPVLSVFGEVYNPTSEPRRAPLVRINLRNETGTAVEAIYAELDQPLVGPGERARFSSRLDSPPLEAFDLEVSFVLPEPEDAVMTVDPSATDPYPEDTGAPDAEPLDVSAEPVDAEQLR